MYTFHSVRGRKDNEGVCSLLQEHRCVESVSGQKLKPQKVSLTGCVRVTFRERQMRGYSSTRDQSHSYEAAVARVG